MQLIIVVRCLLQKQRYTCNEENSEIGKFINCIKIFEGGYKNGERNGKGKEYEYNSYKERLIFEGEYLYGKRIKGKEYDNFFGYLLTKPLFWIFTLVIGVLAIIVFSTKNKKEKKKRRYRHRKRWY